MMIITTYWLPVITNWWWQQEETQSMYTDLSNVACDSCSIIPHGVRVEDSFSLRRDVIGLWQSKTTAGTLRKEVVLRQFTWANNRWLEGEDPVLDTTSTDNDMVIQREADGKMLHWMAKIHDIFEMWHGSHDLPATQKESHAHNIQMTPVGYISNTEKILKASWSNFQHDGVAAFKFSQKSPVPPALSEKNCPGGQTQVFNSGQIKGIDRHSVETDEDSSPKSISDIKNWLNGNGDFDNPNDSDDI